MSEILSQAEIEALLSSLSDDPAPSGPAITPSPIVVDGGQANFGGFVPATKAGSKGAIAYEVYDFRRPDKFSKEQLRTLQMLHETFARQAGSQLSTHLRAPVTIDLISLEQVPYEEYLRAITQSVFTIMSLPPLSGQAVIEVEFPLVFTMLDRLLGGPGRSINRSVLTDIERPLLRSTVERIFSALKQAWEGVVIVNPGIEAVETSTQFVQIAPPSDIVVTILFEVKVGNTRGAMSLCVPYLVLKPITTKLSAQKWFVASARKPSATNRRILASQVQGSSVECAIILGDCRLHIRDFLRLAPGDVLRLNRKVEHGLPVLVNGNPKFEGKPALKGKKLVFTLTHVN